MSGFVSERTVRYTLNSALVAGGTNDDTPLLDDGVVVGVGAVVLGGVAIGKNIAVGANAVVNKSFFGRKYSDCRSSG